MLDLGSSYLAMRRVLDDAARDPLARWHPNGAKQLEVIEHVAAGHDTYVKGANKWGKTTVGGAFFVAQSRGKRTFCGVRMPRVPLPNTTMVLSLDYRQQELSVQRAYLGLIGDHPHKVSWLPGRSGQIAQAIHVRPDGWTNEDESTWSRIQLYSQENRRSGVGARAHGLHADEPPRERIYREARKAGEPGYDFPKVITATPTLRSLWEWLKKDFPAVPGRVVKGRVMLEASVYDALRTENNPRGSLTQADIDELLELYEGDPLRKARLYGLECNTDGASPFHRQYAELEKWLEACFEPEWQEWAIVREVPTPRGMELVEERVSVEIYEPPDTTETYLGVIDASLGIDDGAHDPGELQIWAMRRPRLVARYNGYIGAYGLGILGAGLGRYYHDALLDPDTTGGYGGPVLTALRDAEYHKIAHDSDPGRGGKLSTELGFTINAATRAQFISSLQEALGASASGHRYLWIWSEDVIRELRDLIVDARGRIVTGPGMHDESLTCAGRAAWRALRAGVPREPNRRVETPRSAGMKRMRASMGLPERAARARKAPPKMRRAPR